MSQNYLQPKCKAGGNKGFHTGGSEGRSDRPLAGTACSGLRRASANAVKSWGHHGKEERPGSAQEAVGVSTGGRCRQLRRRQEGARFQGVLWAVESGPVGAAPAQRTGVGAASACLLHAPLASLIKVDNVFLCQLQEGCA